MTARPGSLRGPLRGVVRPGAGALRLAAAGMLSIGGALAAGLAQPAAAQSVTLRVTLVQVEAITDYDDGSEADHYAIVAIPGETLRTSTIDEWDNPGSEAEPAWSVTFDVTPTGDPVPVRIELWDSDLFGDDHIDIGIESGLDLLLQVDLATCQVTADILPPPGAPLDVFPCGQTILTAGTATDRAALRFRVEVEFPPTTAGTNVQCLHSPIWPQPGDTVAITAQIRDGSLNPKFGTVEIFTNGEASPLVALGGVSQASAALTVQSPSFAYGCKVTSGSETAWTGWRRVTVGDPPELAGEKAVPVVYVAPRRSAIDVVFVADRTVYASADDPLFLGDVSNALMAYYGLPEYLAGQDRFNFWIARETGRAEGFEQGCDHDVEGVSFADVHAILHTYPFSVLRDCAPGGRRLFSASTTMFPGVVRHETGHRPFGLADEYCCDGGYYEADPFPNVYEEPETCADDAPSLEDAGVPRTAADCRNFREDVGWWEDVLFNNTWWISEPQAADLMVNNTIANAADRRRIQWLLDRCRRGDC